MSSRSDTHDIEGKVLYEPEIAIRPRGDPQGGAVWRKREPGDVPSRSDTPDFAIIRKPEVAVRT